MRLPLSGIPIPARLRPILAAALIVLAVGAAPPDEHRADERQDGVVTRYEADLFRDVTENGRPVSYLLGNVKIVRDTLTVEGDSALYYRDRDFFDVRGSVRLIRPGAVLTCLRGTYDQAAENADFRGDVRIEEGETIGTGDRAEMRRAGDLMRLIGSARLVAPEYVVWADTILRYQDGRGEAAGSVRFVDPGAQTLVTGEHAIFSREGGEAVVDRDPVLVSREQGSDELNARSGVMTFQDDDRVVMVDSVRIRQGASLATADTARILGRQRLILRGSPRLDDGQGSTFVGDEMEFTYRGGEMKTVHLRGSARVEDTDPDSLAAVYRGLPAINVIEGDTITLHFEGGEARRSVVVGDAHSVYIPTDVDDEISFNDVSGDTIVIDFDRGKVAEVDVRGKMEGVYSFAKVSEMAADVGLALADSAAPDTVAGASPFVATAMDFTTHRETVDYAGDRVEFRLREREIEITGKGSLDYGTMALTAGRIRMNTTTRELHASEDPLLEDKSQKIAGRRMAYNFEHKTGVMGQAVTTMDEFYYVGENIKRFDDGELKIRSGRMTSCDLEHPHYHFWSNRMKIKPDDKVVAMPVVMKVGEVPVFALPFYFKSLKSGRRSGILFPSFNFGWSQRTGRYIRDWGYYWATNDYTDFTFRGDYNERRELTWRIDNRYKKRYSFDGDVSYSRRTTLGEGDKVREWQFNWTHSQPALFDDYQFNAKFKMSSSTISRSDLLNDLGGVDQINGQQTSTMYLKRNFGLFNSSLNFKRDEFVNKEDDDPNTNNRLSSQSFPQLSVSFKSMSLLPSLKRGQDGSFLGDLLRNTYLSQSYRYGRVADAYELTDRTVDSASGSASLSLKPPKVWIFNVSTGVSGGYSWQRTTTEGRTYTEFEEPLPGDPDSLVTVGMYESLYQRADKSTTSMSINSSVGTTLYGVFRPRIGRLSGLRHTLGMSMSHSLSPAIRGKQTRSERYGFSLSNRLDVKYLGGGAADDTTRGEKKLDGVLDWRLSTGYNPERASDKWDDISSSLQIKPGSSSNLRLKMSNTISAMDFHVMRTSVNYGLSLSGEVDTGGGGSVVEQERNRALGILGVDPDSTAVAQESRPAGDFGGDGDFPDFDDEDDDFSDEFAGFDRIREGSDQKDPTEGGRLIPWRMNTNLSYSRNHDTGTVSARANLNLNLTLTRTWGLNYTAGYDFDSGMLTSQRWRLSKDLHCWKMEFSRQISSVDSQFGFVIALKQIPAIKLTRGKEDLVNMGSSLSGGIF